MTKRGGGTCSRGAAAASVALVGWLAGCGPELPPEPVVSAPPQARTITIERGQTLSGIAQNYRLPLHELAEANHLLPPYLIHAGGVLVIPATAVAALPPAAPVPATAPPVAPPPPETVGSPSAPPPTIRSAAPAPEPVASAPRPPKSISSESATAQRPASPPAEAAAPVARSQPAAPPAGSATAAPPARTGTAFVWPVHGHILAGYGAGPDGTHNDGLNIAAPRGAAVEAVDAGVVAYAGNELRGYGNLLLIKHQGGWISAYAHCDAILVKPGQKIARGQVIARVGSSGNVSTPQLHFELRRGNKPVDPRAYLSTLPSASAVPARPG
jgi:murein DD-endopeptidase MepM/ murein hydrolase activator NlpD